MVHCKLGFQSFNLFPLVSEPNFRLVATTFPIGYSLIPPPSINLEIQNRAESTHLIFRRVRPTRSVEVVLTSKSSDPTVTHIVHIMCKFLNKLLFLYRKSYGILIYTALTAFRPNPTRLAYPRSPRPKLHLYTYRSRGIPLPSHIHTHTGSLPRVIFSSSLLP